MTCHNMMSGNQADNKKAPKGAFLALGMAVGLSNKAIIDAHSHTALCSLGCIFLTFEN
ncbi:hypothetical protein GCE9029_03668 [Grimontia celer]|uniref:Uncharacterized protein n=1 Tax=Grimontia celer TaxID=1796497 RepID=A0A128F8L7_9GAMM|nr:hypothetical protein GCE9029_03668 [Grimontia celer]